MSRAALARVEEKMSLFSKKKTQVIKFEQNLCNADVNDNKVLFVRVSDMVDDKEAILEVPFTHNALLIKGGGDCRLYKSGTYPVFDDKNEVKNWKKGISVEVIYIPKETSVKIEWGTPNKVMYRDKTSNKVIEIGANGVFGISVCNPEQFFRKVVGFRKEFDLDEFSRRFTEAVTDEFADHFLSVVNADSLTYDKFDENRKVIAKRVGKELSDKFAHSWGLELVDFIISEFKISKEDMARVESFAEEKAKEEKLKEHLAEIERLDDKQWEREKYLRQLEQHNKEAYYDVMKVIGKDSTRGNGVGQFCSACGHSYESTDKFCPGCGRKVGQVSNICPSCGKENALGAAFCSGCGKKL